MKHDDKIRLRHMYDACQKVVAFCKGCSLESFCADEKLSLAVVRLLEVVGEAAVQISDNFQEQHPEIPWREISGTRNRLIHGYFDVDMRIVWQIASTDIPALFEQLKTLV